MFFRVRNIIEIVCISFCQNVSFESIINQTQKFSFKCDERKFIEARRKTTQDRADRNEKRAVTRNYVDTIIDSFFLNIKH